MRLYLSSYRLGNRPEELLELLNGGTRAAVIANAADYKTPEERTESLQKDIDDLTALGLTSMEIDLREYFGKKELLREELSKYDLVWVRGGNAFILRRAFKHSSADEVIKDLLDQNKLVYGGYSAGVCLLAPALHGIDLVDDPHITPDEYSADILWEGLNILPYSITPHYKSNHPESDAIDKCIKYFEDKKIPYKPLKDGEVIIIDRNKETLLH